MTPRLTRQNVVATATCVFVLMMSYAVLERRYWPYRRYVLDYMSPLSMHHRTPSSTGGDHSSLQMRPDNFEKLLFGVELADLKNRSYNKQEPFTFISDYKNPCWLEHLPSNYIEDYKKHVFRRYGKKQIQTLRQIYSHRLQNQSRPWRLRCLPYFYLLGVTKSGTTDFFDVITKHPQVHGPWVKEPMYWNRRRYPNGAIVHKNIKIAHDTFNSYLNLFDHEALRINRSEEGHRHIIVDGSSYLFWEDNGWQNHPDNRRLTEPGYTTAMALHTAQPEAKLIVLMRNPIDRLYSDYVMLRGAGKELAQKFHRSVTSAIFLYKQCLQRHTDRACANNASLSRKLFPVTLSASLYSIHLRDWLKVFPRKQILLIKSEDYYKDRLKVLRHVCEFLDIADFGNRTELWLKNKTPSFRRTYDHMMIETRTLLQSFFQPYNEDLERLLHRNLWPN